MAATVNIVDFGKGEQVQINLAAKDRSGAALDLTGGTVTIAIASAAIGEAAPDVEFSSPSTQVTITDAAAGTALITLAPADLTAIPEDRVHYYGIWTDTSAGVRIWQAEGKFRLRGAVQPSA